MNNSWKALFHRTCHPGSTSFSWALLKTPSILSLHCVSGSRHPDAPQAPVTVSARIKIRVKPRASRDAIEGWKDGELIVRLTAPPVDGAANSLLVKLLAKKVGLARNRIRIVSGEKGRSKVVEFEDLALDELKERLE